ncbi:mechanosensitive ion channel [Candidatus Saccharibacteria bacterium]|nr:mechanosensitive ion channel [Candidatus Saccharibacteria bacterium]
MIFGQISWQTIANLVVIFILMIILLKLAQSYFLTKLTAIYKKTKAEKYYFITRLIQGKNLIIIGVAFLLATHIVRYPAENYFLQKLAWVALIILLTKEFIGIISHIILERLLAQHLKHSTARLISDIIGHILSVVIWIVVGLVVLQNVGVQLTALIGSLGILGVALAFGVQSILTDILAYFSIIFDRPFELDDYVVLGKDRLDSGVVKKIGIKSTRIESINGEQIIVPNKELTNIRLYNYAKLNRRRVELVFYLDYHSTQAKRTKLPIEVKSALSKIGEIEYQDCYLNNLDQFGIGYKLVYFLADRDFVKHLQIRQSVTEQLLEVIQGLDLVLIGKSFSVDQ